MILVLIIGLVAVVGFVFAALGISYDLTAILNGDLTQPTVWSLVFHVLVVLAVLFGGASTNK